MTTSSTTKAKAYKSKTGPGRRSDLVRGLEALKFRHSPLELCDLALAQATHVQALAKQLHPHNPFGAGLVVRSSIQEGLTISAAALEGIPGQARLRAFLLAIANGANNSEAANSAGVSREWASKRLFKVTALLVIRYLDAKFR